MTEPFKLGNYRHYKGGTYTAIALVTHHDTRKSMVLYVSHTTGAVNVRPLDGWSGDSDAWNDAVVCVEGVKPRFQYIGPPLGEKS